MRPLRRFRASWPALVFTFGALAGCSSVPLTSSNLDALMDDGDNLRHRAKVESVWRYQLRGLLNTKWLTESSYLSKDRLVKVGDPSYEALKYLIELESTSSKSEYAQLEKVRQFARYAVRCKGRLARERALLALLPHAVRLEVTQPASEPEEPANAAELQSALQGLVQAARPLLLAEGRADATKRKDLEAAATLFRGLTIDVDGGWRALQAIGTLAAVVDFDREELHPMRELGRDLQKRLIRLALASGLNDPDPHVRAAAARVTYDIAGDAFLVDLLYSMIGGGREQRASNFGLRRESPTEPNVFIAAYELVGEHGLPMSADLPPIEQRRERIELLQGILSVIYETELFGDRQRSAAMLALGRAVPEGPGELREEAWIEWWETWAKREATAIQAELSAQEGARS